MREPIDALRDQVVRVLAWEDAHAGFDKAIAGIPPAARGARATGFEHSPWQLLEHMRLAQDDILDFCINARYEHTMAWKSPISRRRFLPARKHHTFLRAFLLVADHTAYHVGQLVMVRRALGIWVT